MTPRQFAAECRACNPFTDPETASVYLKAAADNYEGVIEQAKAACERKYRDTIDQYAEQVERLRERISDLEDELEDKRIELAQLGGLDLLIERFKSTTERSEAVAERLEAVQVKADKPVEGKTKKEPAPKPKGGKALERYFNEFWAAYPKKRAKQNALKSWQRLAPDKELHTKIMAALAEQKKSAEWKREGGRFIPYPATWLNGGCWDDEVAAAQSDSGGSEHSYDLNKLLAHAQENVPTIKEGGK